MDSNFLLPWGDTVTHMQMCSHAYSTYPDLFSETVRKPCRFITNSDTACKQYTDEACSSSNSNLSHFCAGQESSLFSTNHSPSPISSFLLNATHAAAIQMLPLWGKPFTFKLDQYRSQWCIYSIISIKSTPRCMLKPAIWVRNGTALWKSWLNFKIRVRVF